LVVEEAVEQVDMHKVVVVQGAVLLQEQVPEGAVV
jgi:hypothetical protein